MKNQFTKKLWMIAVIILIFIAACIPNSESHRPQVQATNIKQINVGSISYSMYEFEYDGCQYILYCQTRSGGITHKGNCKNPEHNNK